MNQGFPMQPFTLFIDYLPKGGAARRTMEPMLVEASSEEDAVRIASAVATFAYPEVCEEMIIRLVGSNENGRVIGEIRRPQSD